MADDVVLEPAPATGGEWLAALTAVTTAIFVVLTGLGLFFTGVRYAVLWYDMALFVAGIAGFVVAIFLSGARALGGTAVRASGLFLGAFAPRRERLVFQSCLAITSVVGLGAALIIAQSDDAGPFVLSFPAMAFGILVPILPPALAGIHGARYCPWPKRA